MDPAVMLRVSRVLAPDDPLFLKVSSILSIPPTEYKSYKRRWYILIFFSLAAALQNVLWLTYNTMGDITKDYYNASDALVNMFSTIAIIVFVVTVLPISLLVNNYGLRKSMIAAAGLLAMCGVGRVFFQGKGAIAVIFVLQTANALVAPIVNSTPSMLAGVWFPTHERSMATAVSFLAQFMGTAVAFLMGFIIKSEADIPLRLYIEAGITIAVTVPIFAYFPDGPPTPPSASSCRKVEEPQDAVGRHYIKELNKTQLVPPREGLPTKNPLLEQAKAFISQVKEISSSKPFWLSTISGGIAAGLYAGWSGVLTSIMLPLGYSASQVGSIGVSSAVAAMIGGVVVGRIAGRYPTKLKEINIILLSVCLASAVWFVLSMIKILPSNNLVLIISASIASLTMNATTPLFFELNIELTYPSPEAATGGILTLMLNLFAVVFMLADNVLSPTMINAFFVLLVVISLVIMIFTPVEYKRAAVDMAANPPAASSAVSPSVEERSAPVPALAQETMSPRPVVRFKIPDDSPEEVRPNPRRLSQTGHIRKSPSTDEIELHDII